MSAGGRTVSFPVGHDQIVTLRITGLPDAGLVPLAPAARTARLPVVSGNMAPEKHPSGAASRASQNNY